MTPKEEKGEKSMGKIKAGVVVVTKFCKSHAKAFSGYIDYIDRESAARTENTMKYNLYQDYMGNPEKTSGLFTRSRDIKTDEEKQSLKNTFEQAQKNGSLMWQTVISFDNRFLEKNGLYFSEDEMLDEERIKGITRSAVRKMLDKEKLENAVWSAAIHYNTDNVHVHIAIVEPVPMREKKMYTQYKEKVVNGKTIKEPVLNYHGNPVEKEEYKGRFKLGSVEACKREVVNEIINERENNRKINSIIRGSILKQKREHTLSKDKDLCQMFLKLHENMPDCNRNMWNYNNPIMHSLKPQVDEITIRYIEKYHKEEYRQFEEMIHAQAEKYREAYGGDSDYAKGKKEDLYSRMGNAVLKEIRAFDKERLRMEQKENQETEKNFDNKVPEKERQTDEGVTRDPLITEPENKGVIRDPYEKQNIETINLVQGESYDFSYEPEDGFFLEWSKEYKRAKRMMHGKNKRYEAGRRILEREEEKGNVLAAYELADLYRYGRGVEIDTQTSEKYYEKAFRGFCELWENQSGENQFMEQYLPYRLGKMYYYGLGTGQNYEKAAEYFRESKDNVFSKYMLGKMAYSGQGMEQDYSLAYHYFGMCAGENPFAAYQAASMIDTDKVKDSQEKMERLYEKAFDGFLSLEQKQPGDSLEYRIGCMCLDGRGIELDEELGEEYLVMSAESGNLYAKNKLALHYLKQERMEKIPEILSSLKEVAEKTENIWSMYALGNIYSSDKFHNRDMEQAVYWYEKAEQDGNEYISYRLGKIYLDEESECYNIQAGMEHMEKALEKGNVTAAYQLGKIFMDEKKEYFNPNKAVEYFVMAAKKDSGYAAYQLGKLHYDEKYGMKNDTEAYRWFEQSVKKGNERAYYPMAKIDYAGGNFERAVRNFQKVNDEYSHYYLGKIFLNGDRKNPCYNPEKGIAYLERAAGEGNSFAELELGLVYLRGKEVKQNRQKGEAWLKQAEEHGNEYAGEILKNWKIGRRREQIHLGVSLTTAVSKMKKALKSEWEKSKLEREHDRMIEQSLE